MPMGFNKQRLTLVALHVMLAAGENSALLSNATATLTTSTTDAVSSTTPTTSTYTWTTTATAAVVTETATTKASATDTATTSTATGTLAEAALPTFTTSTPSETTTATESLDDALTTAMPDAQLNLTSITTTSTSAAPTATTTTVTASTTTGTAGLAAIEPTATVTTTPQLTATATTSTGTAGSAAVEPTATVTTTPQLTATVTTSTGAGAGAHSRVEGRMDLTVPDCDAFAALREIKFSLASSIAEAAGGEIGAGDVRVWIECKRRLASDVPHIRRLKGTRAVVTYIITIPDSTAVDATSVATALRSETPASMKEKISIAMRESGIDIVEVSVDRIEPPVISTPAPETTTAGPRGAEPDVGQVSIAWRPATSATLVAVVGALATAWHP